jgi:hypothetical protein
MLHGWLLLLLSLPPRPSSLRVRAWRRLRVLGAVPLRSSAEIPGSAIPFDMAGVDFGHHGEYCTFETLLRGTGLRDRKLAILAGTVHEADLKDQKFAREEARGIDLTMRALLSAIKDDHEALAQGFILFDGLYATVGERS